MMLHPSAALWAIPPARAGRFNLRELAARPGRFEHHLVPVATIGPVQLEVATASEPLYFAHINISDEYAVALPTGDALVDQFPLRTFVSDPESGADLGRYNHRAGDLVLHPLGLSHWPGRLRPPYEPPAFPPGMRRAGVSLVYCATVPTPSTAPALPPPGDRADAVKAYVTPAPPLVLAPLDRPGVVAAIGTTTLEMVVAPRVIAPPRGGWVVILAGGDPHAPCDLVRVARGAELAGDGIERALVFAATDAEPDPIPPAWTELPPPPFAPYEDGAPGTLPITRGDLAITEDSAGLVAISIGDTRAVVPRYWLARMLFRVALHGLRLGFVATYGGFFIDDRGAIVAIGIPGAAIQIPRGDAISWIEQVYRAVAPSSYVERI